jgi:hypothetical protein
MIDGGSWWWFAVEQQDFWPGDHYQRRVQSASGKPMRRGRASAGLLHWALADQAMP